MIASGNAAFTLTGKTALVTGGASGIGLATSRELAAAGAEVNRTDGARVSTSDGWWLLRASNTQDVLVARAEAKDQAGLDRLVAQIDEQLALSGVARGPQAGH